MRFNRNRALIIGVAAVALVAGCEEPAVTDLSESRGPAAAQQEEVKTRDYVDSIALPGAWVQGFEVTQLVAKQAGYVAEIGKVGGQPVDIGTRVKQGDILAVLEIPELEQEWLEKQANARKATAQVAQAAAAIVQADAAIKIAQAEITQAQEMMNEAKALTRLRKVRLDLITRLVTMGAAETDRKDEATFEHDAATAAEASRQAAILTAQANLVSVRANLVKAKQDKLSTEAATEVAGRVVDRVAALWEYRNIKAPFGGVITARHVDRGAFVRPAGSSAGGSPLFEIASTDMLRIVAYVPAGEVAGIEPGKQAEFHSIGGLSGVRIPGTVTRSASALDQDSRKMRIEMHVPNPVPIPEATDGDASILLKLGLYGTLTVTRKVWKNLTVVSTNAVGTDSVGRFVMKKQGADWTRIAVRQVFDDANQIGIDGDVKAGDIVRTGDLGSY